MPNHPVVLVTGSSRGIGAGIVKGLAEKGYHVVINYAKSEEEARQFHAEITGQFGADCALLVQADVSRREDVKAMFDAIAQKFGRLDVLINNAGLNIDGPFLDMTDEQWQRVIGINLTGTFICSQEFARRFTGDLGHIINIGASTAFRGRKNGVNYCSSKAGVVTLTKCLALELAPNIRVNCVVPGFIETDEVMTRYHLHDKANYDREANAIPLKRLGVSEDIFKTVYFLIHDADYITGQNFFVNGGHFMY